MERRSLTFWAGVAAAVLIGLAPQREARAEWAALGWDHCGSRILAKQFACDTNAGESRLVVSALRDSVAFFTNGFRCVLEVAVDAPSLPSWWQVRSGDCRGGALTSTILPMPEDFGSCAYASSWSLVDTWIVAEYVPATGRLRLTLYGASAIGESQMTPFVETFIVALHIRHELSTGAGSCSGCDTPACVLLRELTIVDGAPTGALVTLPILEPSFLLGWQSDRANCIATPIRNQTWGGIKSLYR